MFYAGFKMKGVEGSLPSGTINMLTCLIAGTSLIGNFQKSELGIEIKKKSFFETLLSKASAVMPGYAQMNEFMEIHTATRLIHVYKHI